MSSNEKNSNVELLEFVFGVAEASKISITHLKRMTQDIALGKLLDSIIDDYIEITKQASAMLADYEIKPKESNEVTRLTSYFAAGLQTIFDKSPSRIGEVVVNGSAMGLVDIARAVRKARPSAEPKALSLAERLLRQEQGNIDRVIEFL